MAKAQQPTARQLEELKRLQAPGMFLTSGGYRRDVNHRHYGAVPMNIFASLIRRGYVEPVRTWAGDSYVISADGLLALPDEPESEGD